MSRNNFIKGLKVTAAAGITSAALLTGCGINNQQVQIPANNQPKQENKQVSREEVIEGILANSSEFKELLNKMKNDEKFLDSEDNKKAILKGIETIEKDSLIVLKIKFEKIMGTSYKNIRVCPPEYDRDGKELECIRFEDEMSLKKPIEIKDEELENCPELVEFMDALDKLQANKRYGHYGVDCDNDTIAKVVERAATVVSSTEGVLNNKYIKYGETIQEKEIGKEGDIVLDEVVIGNINDGIDTGIEH